MCKHLRSEHRKGFLGSSNECNHCECFDYMRNDKPLKSDKFIFILGIVVIGIFIIAPIMAYYEMSKLSQEELDQPSEMTVGTEILLLLVILALAFFIVGSVYYDIMIGDYLHQRNRRRHSKR